MRIQTVQGDITVQFVKAFSTTKDEKDRKELYIQFADAYDGSIKGWREKVEQELVDEKLKQQFKEFYNREKQTDIKEFVTVESLSLEDIDQISYLASKELNVMPWVVDETRADSINEFVNSGYSYVAKRENVVLGFILAYKCPTYGGRYYIYIDTFVVNSDAQGQGIGKMLLEELRTDMYRNRIYSMKLMTEREIPAYKIYKHLGFEEMENYVHMQRH